MLYRKIGKTGLNGSILGFGLMRLPYLNDSSIIDEEKSFNMVELAIENGINYFDTAYNYHGLDDKIPGNSEIFLGKILTRSKFRDKILIATKLPSWLVNSENDMDFLLNQQLQRLNVDTIDFYLIHNLNEKFWNHLQSKKILTWLDKIKRDGRVKYVGFSFHDSIDLFKNIVDSYSWDICQIQYNYLDENYQAGISGIEYASKSGLGIIVMEPLLGGKLTNNLPPKVTEIFLEDRSQKTPAELGLRWVWNNPDISVVLSGMSTIEQVKENITIAKNAFPNSLTDNELLTIQKTKEIFKEKIVINCTECRYCLPCPSKIDIPLCFAYYNKAFIFNNLGTQKWRYWNNVKNKASGCKNCGICIERCPQKINIPNELKIVADLLEK